MRIKSCNLCRVLFCVLILLSIFILSLTNSMAWTGYTHNWICNKANLSHLNCALADNSKMQSQHPDIIFKNHHCTSNNYDCSARKIADKYMTLSTPNAKDFSAHLYADSMVPVHWYSFDYDTCHKIFEDTVEKKLKESDNKQYLLFDKTHDFSSWNFTMVCPAKFGKDNYTDVKLYVDNMYMDTVARYVAEQMHTSYVPTTVKTTDLTPIVYVMIVILIIILILFIVFGLKNRNNN